MRDHAPVPRPDPDHVPAPNPVRAACPNPGPRQDPCPFEEAVRPGHRKWAHEGADALSVAGIRRNREELRIAEACAPSGDDDVHDHAAKLCIRLGTTPGHAMGYADAGTMLARMPRLAKVLHDRGHLSFGHVKAIAKCVLAVPEEVVGALERRILALVVPRRDGQAMKGWRTLYNRIQDVVEELAPPTRPEDLEPEPDIEPGPEPVVEEIHAESVGSRTTVITMVLDRPRAHEFLTALDAIARTADCTRAEALTHLTRASIDVDVTLNMYRDPDSDRSWAPGVGWLSEVATRDWMSMVSGIRLVGDSATDGYVPTDAQRAFVVGRDGTCRFPGCDVPAHKCDIDHIQPYDHKNPEAGGPTDTENLHCLCRRHHNLKTARMWDVLRAADGTEYWSSKDGAVTCAGVPEGPVAGPGRVSFDARLLRRRSVLAEHNAARLERRERNRTLVADSREADELFQSEATVEFIRHAEERADHEQRLAEEILFGPGPGGPAA